MMNSENAADVDGADAEDEDDDDETGFDKSSRIDRSSGAAERIMASLASV